MKETLQAFGVKRWNDFRGFTPGQKAVTIAAVVALLVGGYLLLNWKPATTYQPLYTGLSSTDASAMADKLTAQNIPYKLAGGGTEIDVPPGNAAAAKAALSAAGLPGGGNGGYSILDKEGVTTSQFKQQVDYQRAIEGELDKTIQGIAGVKSASVHLAIPQQDVFNDNSQKPTAAVLVATQPGLTLGDAQVQSIVNLVRSSVPGMTSNNVTVSDAAGNVLYAPGQGTNGLASADSQAKATQAYNNQVAASIDNMLTQAIGPNHASVTVNSTLDFSQTRTTTRNYTYNSKNPPVSSSINSKTYKGAGAGAGGTLGTTTDTTGTGTAGSNGQYVEKNEVVNNALGTVTQTSQNAPGQLKNLSIAVLFDKSVKGLNLPQLSQLIKSGVGFNATRGDTFNAAAMTFNTTAQNQIAKAAKAAQAAQAAQASQSRLIGWAKQGVLVLLISILIIGAILANRKRKKQGPEPDDDLLDFVDPEPNPPANEASPVPLAPVKDLSSVAAQRRELVTAAGDRPTDMARVLSNWLNTKES